MSSYPLRRCGPSVFVSYSFADAPLAEQLRTYLLGRGCQVQMEDDRSLLNERLPDILSHRIDTAEVFVQLRTKTSNASYWVDQELRLAASRRSGSPNFVLIPLVLDRSNLDGEVANWVQIDASKAGLTNLILDAVFQAAQAAVHHWPLRDDDPTQFQSESVEATLATYSNKRIITDSNGVLLEWMDAVLDYLRERADLTSVLEQELRHRDALQKACGVADIVARRLIGEIAFYARRGWYDHRSSAAHAVNRYCRLGLGREAIRLWSVTPLPNRGLPRKTGLFGMVGRQKDEPVVKYRQRFSAAPDFDALNHLKSNLNRHEHQDGYFQWALSPHGANEHPHFEEVVLIANDDRTTRVFIPTSAIEADPAEAIASIQMNPAPIEIVTEHIWAAYVLPQLAAYAGREIGGAVGPVDASAADRLLDHFPWRREDYRAMGLP